MITRMACGCDLQVFAPTSRDWTTQLPSARIFRIQISNPPKSQNTFLFQFASKMANRTRILNPDYHSRIGLVQIERTLIFFRIDFNERISEYSVYSFHHYLETLCSPTKQCACMAVRPCQACSPWPNHISPESPLLLQKGSTGVGLAAKS